MQQNTNDIICRSNFYCRINKFNMFYLQVEIKLFSLTTGISCRKQHSILIKMCERK